MTPDLQVVRDATLARIAEDAESGALFAGRRLHGWNRDELSEEEAERWLAAHPDDPGLSLEAVARTQWEDAGADNYCPDDRFDRPDGLCPGREGVL